jgi:hypothetical protein
MTDGSAEAAEVVGLGSAREGEEGDDPLLAAAPQGGKTPALDQFTTNLTQRARDGKVDPVIGRDGEIRQVIDILMRRRQNHSSMNRHRALRLPMKSCRLRANGAKSSISSSVNCRFTHKKSRFV